MSTEGASASTISVGAITLVATLISIYIVSQFLRNSIGVIAPNLAQGLEFITGSDRTSFQHVLLCLRRRPNSSGLDRFGPRICLVVGAAITVAGSVVFASAATPVILILGRALLGLGTAGSLVASLAVYANRFPPHRFATLTGLQVGIGTVGTLIATAPLAFSAATIGWRQSFLLVGAFTFVIASLIVGVLRHGAYATRSRLESLSERLRSSNRWTAWSEAIGFPYSSARG
jgi:MFS family permease